jgi:hypothetical protein
MFALGWLMAELFDSRRQESVTEREPPFNPAVQLPLVSELRPHDRLNFLVADLGDLLAPLERLSDEAVRAGADKRKPVSAKSFDSAEFDSGEFDSAVTRLHKDILNCLANDQEQLYAYQLGLALSDLCWVPSADGLDGFIATFQRGQLASLRMWLDGAGTKIPVSSAAIVGKSLESWQDWIDVNTPRLRLMSGGQWVQPANPVLKALRVQGSAWHSVLTAAPDVSVNPAMGAWIHAASSVARAAQQVSATVVRRFWPVAVITMAALAGLLYLVTANLSGTGEVWAGLVTVGGVLGGSGVTLGTAVSRAFGGIGNELWSVAKLEAQAWNVTWLPAMRQTTVQRTQLEIRGVAAPQIRKNLDVR